MEIASTVKALRVAADIYGKAKKIPEQKQILDGLTVISVLQQEKFELQEKVRELESKLRAADDQLKQKEEYRADKGVIWRVSDSSQEQPYCPVCYSNGRVVPLQKCWDGRDKTRSPWACPDRSCSSSFNPWDHQERSSSVVESGGSSWFDPDEQF